MRARWVVGLAMGASASTAHAKDREVEPAQLVTYVKPVLPAGANAGEAHTVWFMAKLGADGRLHELKPVDASDALVNAAKAAAEQWVYVPFKVKGQAVETAVHLSVAVGGGEHVVTPKEPVLLSTKLMPQVRASGGAGGHGMVPIAVRIGRDSKVESAKGMSGPEPYRATAEETVKRMTFPPYLLDGVPVEVGSTVQVVF